MARVHRLVWPGCAFVVFAAGCSGSDSSGGEVTYAERAGTAEQVGELGEDELQPAIGEGCPEGTFLRGWDPDRGTPICGTAETTPGPPGEQGEQGPPGMNGEDGTDGTDGNDGTDGTNGVAGPAGPAGPAGSAGPSGPAGSMGDKGDKGDKGDVGDPGTPGLALTWLGSFASAPVSPSTNDAYYDSTDGIAYVYANGSWQTLAQDGADGTNGTNGTNGQPGPPGPQGATGAPAPSGSGTPYGAAVAASFAGYTTATVTGGQAGGRHAMHALCAAQFTNGHLCHASEYWLSNSATQPPAQGAWLDSSWNLTGGSSIASNNYGDPFGGRDASSTTSRNCTNWGSAAAGYSGSTISPAGFSASTPTSSCDVSRSLACCDTPSRESFAGFTTATTTGNMGGRAMAHFLCGAEFSGSHMCHGSEYWLTNSSVAPPAQGAWIDASFNISSGSSTGSYSFGDPLGARDASATTSRNCVNWTSASSGYTGGVIGTAGYSAQSAFCDVARPIACCIRK